jgi:hypothetical protein
MTDGEEMLERRERERERVELLDGLSGEERRPVWGDSSANDCRFTSLCCRSTRM